MVDPLQVIEGLRGCGGAGFPTAFKWRAVLEASGAAGKLVVCNADEGEPGTFKDGWLLSERPGEVARGMLEAGRLVGADRGFLYLRPEYTRQLEAWQNAVAVMVERGELSEGSGQVFQGEGFPGRPIVRDDGGLTDAQLASLDWHVHHGTPPTEGTQPREPVRSGADLPPADIDPVPPSRAGGVKFKLDVCIGGGAYICGEETAMLESMEGRRPQPRHKPPFPTTHGLWGRPTLINNVETFWWAHRYLNGDAEAPGAHRLYSLSGAVQRPGVYEAPVGITTRGLIDEFGGGLLDGAEVACFIPGGAATGVLPPSLLDVPLSPDRLDEVGTAPGTAGVVVYAEPTDPRDVATQIMRFFAQESCSQCTPCRLGCRAFADWLGEEATWPGSEDSERWLEAMELGSICGLGFTAPLVVRQLDRWFQEARR